MSGSCKVKCNCVGNYNAKGHAACTVCSRVYTTVPTAPIAPKKKK